MYAIYPYIDYISIISIYQYGYSLYSKYQYHIQYICIYIILGIFIYSGLTCYEISTLLINGED